MLTKCRLGIFVLSFFAILQSEVLIITHSYKRADFIEIQAKTFKKFLKDDYRFVVFNDATDKLIEKDIRVTCHRLGITCMRIPQKIHKKPYLFRLPEEGLSSASIRCANVVQYSLNALGFKHDGLVMIIDSDMFLVQDFSITEFMKGYDIAGVAQSRDNKTYIWNGLVFLNMPTLPEKTALNFNCGKIEETVVDVGGYTYYYLQAHPALNVHYFTSDYVACGEKVETINFDNKVVKFLKNNPHNVEFMCNKTFLHYRGGSNWDHQSADYHKTKTKILNDYIEDLLA